MVLWLFHLVAEHLRAPPATHQHDPHAGMHPALYALIFGIVSGTSLPIGAALGIIFSPVPPKFCALMMAFGAGALLFAVTVELYGHALMEVAHGRLGLVEMFTTIGGALIGAAFYLTINQWLERYLCEESLASSDEDDDEVYKYQAVDDAEAGSDGADVPRDETRPTGKRLSSAKEPRETESLMGALRSMKARDVQKPRKSAGDIYQKTPSEERRISSPGYLESSARTLLPRERSTLLLGKEEVQRIRAREIAMRAMTTTSVRRMDESARSSELDEEARHAKSIALALFLGLLVDGVPEGILMGFLSAEGHLTPVLIISLFIANFPEAFSSASLLMEAQMGYGTIIGMWTGLCILVGCLCGISCWLLLWSFPGYGAHNAELPLSVLLGIALVEGVTGGAMIACISSVMLPEAFERAGKTGPFYSQSGFLCTAGFLLSVALKAVFG